MTWPVPEVCGGHFHICEVNPPTLSPLAEVLSSHYLGLFSWLGLSETNIVL